MGIIIDQYRFGPRVATLTQQSSASSSTQSVTLPSAMNGQDLLILYSRATGVADAGPPNDTTPSGWTKITTVTTSRTVSSVVTDRRHSMYYRLAAGTFGSSSSTASTSVSAFDASLGGYENLVYTFRGDIAPTTITSFSVGTTGTNANPAALTVAGSTNSVPMVILAGYSADAAVDPRTFTVGGSAAKDAELSLVTSFYLAYKIYNSSPADVSIDMDDEGAHNSTIACGLSVA
ncbi:MAG: hypothetical protein ACKO7N_05795 [Candidatus Nitrosotenuis sp.]